MKTMSSLLCLGLIAAIPLTCLADDGRQHFKADLASLSGKALQCQSTLPTGETSRVQYTIELNDDPNYKDAFMIGFSTDQKLEFKTMIAYEGIGGYVIGNLQVTQESSGAVLLKHEFDGAVFTDLTEIFEAESTLALHFSKVNNSGKVVREITCDPVSR